MTEKLTKKKELIKRIKNLIDFSNLKKLLGVSLLSFILFTGSKGETYAQIVQKEQEIQDTGRKKTEVIEKEKKDKRHGKIVNILGIEFRIPSKVIEVIDIEKELEKLFIYYQRLTEKNNNPEYIKKFLIPNKTFSIKDDYYNITVKGDIYFYTGLEDVVKQATHILLTKNAKLIEVGDVGKIEEISGERLYLRRNPEVKQSQIPSQYTLEPPLYTIESLNVILLRERLEGIFQIYPFLNTKAIVEITLRNNENNKILRLTGYGAPVPIELIRCDFISIFSGFHTGMGRRGLDKESVILSILAAFSNLADVIDSALSESLVNKIESKNVLMISDDPESKKIVYYVIGEKNDFQKGDSLEVVIRKFNSKNKTFEEEILESFKLEHLYYDSKHNLFILKSPSQFNKELLKNKVGTNSVFIRKIL